MSVLLIYLYYLCTSDPKNSFMNSFEERLSFWNIAVDRKELDLFEKYYDILIEWNHKFNLTAVTGRDDVYVKHFTDSIALAHYMDLSGKKILDVGSGAGFPGIPLAIIHDDCNIVLIDSLNKRVGFLDTVISSLGLSNVTAVCDRAEELGHDDNFREQFDVVTSRAVAGLNILSEYCLPFVCDGGMFVSYKGSSVDEELSVSDNALSVLGGTIETVEKYNIPFTDIPRSLIFIRKSSATPDKYPRHAGRPLKKPL